MNYANKNVVAVKYKDLMLANQKKYYQKKQRKVKRKS